MTICQCTGLSFLQPTNLRQANFIKKRNVLSLQFCRVKVQTVWYRLWWRLSRVTSSHGGWQWWEKEIIYENREPKRDWRPSIPVRACLQLIQKLPFVSTSLRSHSISCCLLKDLTLGDKPQQLVTATDHPPTHPRERLFTSMNCDLICTLFPRFC
jgi:hypothetical protein